MRAVAKHSPQLAQSVVDCGALDALVICLEEFDPGVKEAAAWALGYIARHNGELAQAVVDAGAVPLLVLCIQVKSLFISLLTVSIAGARAVLEARRRISLVRHLQALARAGANSGGRWGHCTPGADDSQHRRET